MHRNRAVLSTLTLALLLAVLGAWSVSSARGECAAPEGNGPRCTAVIKARPGVTRNVVYRVRCNFLVESLVVQTNARVYSVQRAPRLDDPDAGDRLRCRRGRRDRRDVACRGETGSDVRVVGAFRVSGDPCRLSAQISASGGVDGEPGEAVPRVGYFAKVNRGRPRGW